MVRVLAALSFGLAGAFYAAASAAPAAPPVAPAAPPGGPAAPDQAALDAMRGAACDHCHEDPHGGAVGADCRSCHTTTSWSPSTFQASRHAETKFPLTGKHLAAECSQCHPNGKLVGQPLTCSGCHLDRHRGKLGDACTDCHSTDAFAPVPTFDHAFRTGFALTGTHAAATCDDCHAGARGRAMRVEPEPSCETCHAPGHTYFGPCEPCHGRASREADGSFADGQFDHRGSTGFALERRHSALPCAACHPVPGQDLRAASTLPRGGASAATAGTDCQSCHVDVHAGQLGGVCSDCHRPDRWRMVRFDHDASTFPLRGAHFVTPCASCHASERWIGLPRDCWACHSGDASRGPSEIPAHATGIADCADCHGTWTW